MLSVISRLWRASQISNLPLRRDFCTTGADPNEQIKKKYRNLDIKVDKLFEVQPEEEDVEEVPYNMKIMHKHQAQLVIRAGRRMFLNRAVLNQNKDVIYADLRKPDDHVIRLREKGLCPAVVSRYSKVKEQEIDIVVSGGAMKTKFKSTNFSNEIMYVRADGQQYMCVLNNINFHHEKFVVKAYFQEYVVGKPNKLFIPIEPINWMHNQFIKSGFQHEILHNVVPVICYNSSFPNKLFYDVKYSTPDRQFRAGDLGNTLPPGLFLDPSFDPNQTLYKLVGEAYDSDFEYYESADGSRVIQDFNKDQPEQELDPLMAISRMSSIDIQKIQTARHKEAQKAKGTGVAATAVKKEPKPRKTDRKKK